MGISIGEWSHSCSFHLTDKQGQGKIPWLCQGFPSVFYTPQTTLVKTGEQSSSDGHSSTWGRWIHIEKFVFILPISTFAAAALKIHPIINIYYYNVCATYTSAEIKKPLVELRHQTHTHGKAAGDRGFIRPAMKMK